MQASERKQRKWRYLLGHSQRPVEPCFDAEDSTAQPASLAVLSRTR